MALFLLHNEIVIVLNDFPPEIPSKFHPQIWYAKIKRRYNPVCKEKYLQLKMKTGFKKTVRLYTCIAEYALSRVIFRLRSEKMIWKYCTNWYIKRLGTVDRRYPELPPPPPPPSFYGSLLSMGLVGETISNHLWECLRLKHTWLYEDIRSTLSCK